MGRCEVKNLLSVLVATALVCAAVGSAFVTASAADGYVACSNSDDVIPFDLVSYTLGTPIPLPAAYPYPYDATMSPDGLEVWVPDASGDHVVVIDVATNTISHTIPVGEYPNCVVFTDDGNSALVSSRDSDYVAVIKTSTYTVTDSLYVLTGGGGTYDGPGNMALDPVSKNIYAVDWYDDTLFEIDPSASTVLRSASVGSELWQLVVDPAGQYIYVTDRGPDVVRVIDRATLTEVTSVAVGADPWGIDVTLDGSRLVVACEDVSSVYVIDTSDWSTAVIPLDTGADPRDVDILDSDGSAFVAGGDATATDYVYVIELSDNTIKSSIPVGGNPNCVAVQAQTTSDDVGVEGGDQAAELRLECHPNPFNPKTAVCYHVPTATDVNLAVYDVAGRLVHVLHSGPVDAGDHEVFWNGSSSEGGVAASGVYFVRLDALGRSRTIKAVLLK
jgi:YVTN family beta-propeller protein